MTIEEMRKEMRREVVPEELVPQNIVNRLIDEDAEPPKLDAFSFLTRLRALGIGSGDFLNLLEGCDAPAEVVEKIRENPAMNLQGLILTLENSELTTDDYTRMLLTARQVWERTLTLRLEKSEKISQEVDFSEDADDEPVKVYGEEPPEAEEEKNSEADEDIAEEAPDSEYGEEYDEDMLEMSFTAVLEKINAEAEESVSGNKEATEPEDGKAEASESAEKKEDEKSSAEVADDKEQTAAYITDNENNEENGISFAEAFDKIKREKKPISEETENSDNKEQPEDTPDTDANPDAEDSVVNTSSLVQINSEMLRESFEKSDKSEEQPNLSKSVADIDGDEEYAEEADGNESPRLGYHKGAIIGSTIGAAALIGAGFLIGNIAGRMNTVELQYASDNYDIFEKIYNDHNDNVSGGDTIYGVEGFFSEIFGDLLIANAGDDPRYYTLDSKLYSLTEETISVSVMENGTLKTLEELEAPENTLFVAAFDSNGELYALFSGRQSGYMKIADGEILYTVHQDGVLTDYVIGDGEIKLGTVYTPRFTRTFTINDEDVYLPKAGTDLLKPISAKKIIMTETDGYTYGVSAGYSTEDGSMTDVCAIIGNPVAASADGRFALNGRKGLIVSVNGNDISARETETLNYATFGEGVCAIIEKNKAENITLLDGKLNEASVLTGLKGGVDLMGFDGSELTILSNETYIVDCSDIDAPVPIVSKRLNGVIAGNYALTCEIIGSSIVISRYDLKDGKTEKVAEYKKLVSQEDVEDVRIGDPKTAIIDGEKSGVAFSYFDGVSAVSEYVVFENGKQPGVATLYDDKTGFTAAYTNGGKIYAICSEGVKTLP